MSNEEIIKLIRAGDMSSAINGINDNLQEYLKSRRNEYRRYMRGSRWTKQQVKDMEKKEPKRDKNGRFTKKANKPEVEVNIEVEPKPAKNPKKIEVFEAEYKRLKAERDAFKTSFEKISSLYINKCRECGDVKRERDSYERHFDNLLKVARTWKERALDAQEKHLLAMDAVRTACMYIGWLKHQISWFNMFRHRKDIVNMDIEMDSMVARAH